MINILISVNEAYLEKAKTMLFSMRRYTKEAITVYLLNHRLEETLVGDLKNYLWKKCKIALEVVDVSNTALDDFPVMKTVSIEMYYRILAQFVLPKEMDRILWLDSDIIIMNDIGELYHQEFQGATYLVCPDSQSTAPWVTEAKNKLGLPLGYRYFNSGVMLMNLTLLRECSTMEGILEKCTELKDKLTYPDQDILNCLYGTTVRYLDWKRFNFQIIFVDKLDRKTKKNIVVLHYCGTRKPWNYWQMTSISKYYWKVRFRQGHVGETIKVYIQKALETIHQAKKKSQCRGAIKKVGIVTITELDNYGNRLQNYALQEVLKSLGATVETIPNYITYGYRKSRKWQIKTLFNGVVNRNRKDVFNIIKQWRFAKFDKKYFRFSKGFSDINTISEGLNDEYNYFVAGSDQIWNPYFPFNLNFNFLTFADYDKRIAYSASFGVDDVPNEKREKFKEYLNGIKHISVREYEGQNIVNELTGRDIPVLPDPTLLFTREQWLQLERKPRWIGKNSKYILTYYLGGKEELSKTLDALRESDPRLCDAKVINLNDLRQRKSYYIAPDEFIWLINHAQLMVTDSFHGTVFSILMQTPFLTVSRRDSGVSMNSRIRSLFKMSGITASEGIVTEHIDNSEEVLSRLNMLRAAAKKYLRTALTNEESE